MKRLSLKVSSILNRRDASPRAIARNRCQCYSECSGEMINKSESGKTVFVLKDVLPQILAVSVKNILLLGYGMTLGFPTILIGSLSGSNPNESIRIGEEGISWIGSINMICVPVGASISGAITQPLGRRRAMQLVNIPFLAAWVLFYFSTEVWHVLLALCITGMSGGLLEAPVLTYVAEITEPRVRGILSCTSTMSITLGILCSFLLGTFLSWRNVVLINSTIPIIAFICLMFIPESPYWLISKNRLDTAKKSLAWLRGWTTIDDKKVEEEFVYIHEKLIKEVDETKEAIVRRNNPCDLVRIKKLKVYVSKRFLWPFSILTLAFFLGHFGGNTSLQTYAIVVFSSFHVPMKASVATVLFGFVQLLGITACVVFVHILGKRVISFISLIGSGICFTILGAYAYVQKVNYLDISPSNSTISNAEDVNTSLTWIPVTLIVFTAFLAFLGLKGLPWILIGEVFDNETRASGAGLSAALGYIIGFVANKVFNSMVVSLTLPGVLWFYAGVGFVGFILLYFLLPETEGKTLLEITEHFAGRNKLDNKVGRNKNNITGATNEGFLGEENAQTQL